MTSTATPTPLESAGRTPINPVFGTKRRRNHSTTTAGVALTLFLTWIVSVVAIAAADGFVAEPGLPPWPILLAVVIPVAGFGVGLRIPVTRQAVLGIDPAIWLSVQLWRVVGAAFLFGWAGGELDAGFAIPAGIGDVATGVVALWLLTLAVRRRGGSRTRTGALKNRHVVAFTALGLGDFAVAVATGALLRPDGLETLPWILFPTLAVPFFTMVHIVNWIQLHQPSRSTSSPIPR